MAAEAARALRSARALVLACAIFLQASRSVQGCVPPRHGQRLPSQQQPAATWSARADQRDACFRAPLALRGGFGVIGMSGGSSVKQTASNPNINAGFGAPASQAPGQDSTSPARGGTAFTKIVYAKLPGETPKTVEVAGSWSKFKQRNSMTRNSNGDFEIIMELPRGQHEIKFVINGETWRCHPDLEARKDTQGNQNNIIVVDNVARPSAAAPGGAPSRENDEVYVPSKSSIDIARDVVARLEQEKKTAQEKLAKAHQQLIETLKEELQAGALSLEKSKKLVGTFNETGAVGLKLVREAGETKMSEIRAHMAKIRQILDDKEKIALDTVENEMKRRLGVLNSEVNMYGTVVPDLGDLLEQTHKTIKLSQTDGQTFISKANSLVVAIQEKTAKAAALSPPTDNADFENLSLNLLPPGN